MAPVKTIGRPRGTISEGVRGLFDRVRAVGDHNALAAVLERALSFQCERVHVDEGDRKACDCRDVPDLDFGHVREGRHAFDNLGGRAGGTISCLPGAGVNGVTATRNREQPDAPGCRHGSQV
jgi:hypothetical protein